MKASISHEQFLILVQNTNEVDDSKRHDIPRHRVEKVFCTCLWPSLFMNLRNTWPFNFSMSIRSDQEVKVRL